MYVDESGDTGIGGSPTRFFALSGLVVHESRWREFISVLIQFRKTLRSVYGLPVRGEIHSSEFISKRAFGLERHIRLAILRHCLDELAKLNYINITNVIIDKSNKSADFDVFSAAWGLLFQRFENTLMHGNFPGQHRNDYGIVLTDATAGTQLSRIVRRMAVYNPIPNSTHYGIGFRNIPITKIIEDPYGKDSRQSLPIQMVDVVDYFLHQRYRANSYIRKQRAHLYFDRLAPVLNTYASRYDAMGIVLR